MVLLNDVRTLPDNKLAHWGFNFQTILNLFTHFKGSVVDLIEIKSLEKLKSIWLEPDKNLFVLITHIGGSNLSL